MPPRMVAENINVEGFEMQQQQQQEPSDPPAPSTTRVLPRLRTESQANAVRSVASVSNFGDTSHIALDMSKPSHKRQSQRIAETVASNVIASMEGNAPLRGPNDLEFEITLSDSQSECYKVLKEYDDAMIEGWSKEIDSLLFFSGIFSAVVTGFNVQAYPTLQPNPNSAAILAQVSLQLSSLSVDGSTITSTHPATSTSATTPAVSASLIAINALWFTSLILSLVAASIGILLNQWLREYIHGMKEDTVENLRIRQYRYDGLVRWRVKEIMMLLPLLLQAALMMFLIGLVVLVWTLNPIVAGIVTVLVSLSLAFTLMTTFLPTVSSTCPYKSPQAQFFFSVWHWVKTQLDVAYRRTSPRASDNAGETNRLIDISKSQDWSQREEANIRQSWFFVDAHILEAVRNVNSAKVVSRAGPIAVNAVAMFKDTMSYDDEHEKYIVACLDVVRQYYSINPEAKMCRVLFKGLSKMLDKRGKIGEMAWFAIVAFADRFNTTFLFERAEGVKTLIEFAEKKKDNDRTFIEASLVSIRFCTLLSKPEREDIRKKLEDLLQEFSRHSMGSINRLDSRELSKTLARDLETLVQLAKIDRSFIVPGLVEKFEDILDGMRKSPSAGLTGKLIMSGNIAKATRSLQLVREDLQSGVPNSPL